MHTNCEVDGMIKWLPSLLTASNFGPGYLAIWEKAIYGNKSIHSKSSIADALNV